MSFGERIRSAANGGRKRLPRKKLIGAAVLGRLFQIDRVASPRFHNRMVISAPSTVDEPQPKTRTYLKRELHQNSRSGGFDGIPPVFQFGSIVPAGQARCNVPYNADIEDDPPLLSKGHA